MFKFHTCGGSPRDLEVFFNFYLFRHRLLGGVPSHLIADSYQMGPGTDIAVTRSDSTHQGKQDGLLGMEAILRLLEHD
jgi:hypothetical protein